MYQVKHFPKKSEFCHLGRGGAAFHNHCEMLLMLLLCHLTWTR